MNKNKQFVATYKSKYDIQLSNDEEIRTWPCNLETSCVKRSFVFFKVSITPLENTGVAERGGLGLLENGEAGLELD